MSRIDRREFLKLLSAGAAAGTIPWLSSCSKEASASGLPKDFYTIPKRGNVRILHCTDFHGQLNPVFFREPNVNLGMGDAFGRPPHMVGKQFLKYMGLKENTPEAHAYTYLNFNKAAKQFGRMGGMANMKTLADRLREQVGGRENTLMLDGGDLWQGSGTSLWTRGVDMVEASNILGIDVMVGHWEFTYKEDEVLSNVALFKGDFIGQNVRVKEDSLMDDGYAKLVETFDGRGLYDEDTGHAFQPYVIREVGGARICVVGQAFPRTANANPQEFFPDWSFGLREDDMIELVEGIREDEKPDAIVLLSHNGMDVDVKMAERVPGLNAVFGGHTHDGVPKPLKVKNVEGNQCLVTNAGSNGKFLGVMDFDIQDGKIKSMNYEMLPIFSDALPADKELQAYIDQMRNNKYDKNIVESRVKKMHYNKSRLGKTYKEILDEKLAIAKWTLGILVVMLICVVSGFLDLATASLLGVAALLLSGCIRFERAYRSIDGSIIVLVGGMLPLAMALEKTGVAEWVATQLASLGGIGPWGTLMLLYLFTAVLTQVISNSVTAALVTPIAINLAVAQGVSPQPFIIAMAVAVTTSYATPLTNADILLVREPGHYSMRNYLANGLPIFALQTAFVIALLFVL